jgi:hypothetical protein
MVSLQTIMKGHHHIPVPSGLKLPENATTQPFTAEVDFLLMNGMLMPISVAGVPLYAEPAESMEYGEEYKSEGEEYESEGEEYESEGEEDGCCGAYKKGPEHMCPECPKKGGMGGGFLIAIESALKPKKGGGY